MKKYFFMVAAFFLCGMPLMYAYASNFSATDNPAPSGEIKDGMRIIHMEALQYGYKPDPIVVIEGEKVKLIARASDVGHGFSVTELNISQTMPPGKDREIEFSVDKTGTFTIHCVSYCGPGLIDTAGTLIVLKKPTVRQVPKRPYAFMTIFMTLVGLK